MAKTNRRRGWITKNIQTRTYNMIAALNERGIRQREIAAEIGFKNELSVTLMKTGKNSFSREKYDALRRMYHRVVGTNGTTETPANGAVETTEQATGTEAYQQPNALVAEALADLDQANLLFQSARRRIELATINAERLAQKIREVGLN